MQQKILIVAQSWVGDVVMTQSMLYRIKEIYPDSQLDFLVSTWAMDLVRRIPEVDNVLENPFAHGQLRLRDRIKFSRNIIAKNRYDKVYVIPNSFKAALIPWLAKIKTRIGFVGEMRYGVLNHVYKLDKRALPLMIDRLNYLVAGVKVDLPRYPKLDIDEDNQRDILERFGVSIHDTLVAICPAAEYGPAKRWSPANYAILSLELVKQGAKVLIMGSSKDTEISNEILALSHNNPQIIDLCGKTNLVDVVDILGACQYVISNDSGLMHVACSVGARVIAIFGSSSPNYTPPLSNTAQIIQHQLSCSPCFQRKCEFGHYNCLQLIKPQQVLSLIKLNTKQFY